MSSMAYWLAALFLPLFPLSMAFNGLFAWARNGVLRAALLLVWPQLGLALVFATAAPVPTWLPPLALFTSALYAFRAVALRDVSQWVSYLATSGWALLWLVLMNESDEQLIRFYALGFSAPLAMLALLGARLERGFGAAYTGLYGGLAHMLPRFSGVLVFVVLAIVAAPLFPNFFTMLGTVVAATPSAPLPAILVAGVWLLWTWAGVRLLQGLIVGPANDSEVADLSLASTWVYTTVLIALLVSGIYVTGELP